MKNTDVTLKRDDNRFIWETVNSEIIDELTVADSDSGCGIEEHVLSASGEWIATSRLSGQGEWGYDLLKAVPLERQAGIEERYGYMLDIPVFSKDESFLLGGYGDAWIGGWWSHPDDDFFEDPARGGEINFGWLFKQHLPTHKLSLVELRMDLPQGWIPTDPDHEIWYGPRNIIPTDTGVSMTLSGGIPFEIETLEESIIIVPTPHPDGFRILN